MSQQRVLTEFMVHLHSFRGFDLKPMDKCGTSDPYLKINFDEAQKFTTEYVKKECNPIWNFSERFQYQTSFAKRLHLKNLTIDIYDYNKVKTAKPMGSVVVDLKTIATGPVMHDLPVVDEDGASQGRLQFCVEMLQVENVTVVFNDLVCMGLSVEQGSLRPILSYCFSDSRGDSVSTEEYTEDGHPTWLRPPRLTFKSSLSQLLSNSIVVSALNKKSHEEYEGSHDFAEKIAHFELRFQKYHSFKSLEELHFREKAIPPVPPHDEYPPLPDAMISGKMTIVKFPTLAQMVSGVHNEHGIINARKFMQECTDPDISEIKYVEEGADISDSMSKLSIQQPPGSTAPTPSFGISPAPTVPHVPQKSPNLGSTAPQFSSGTAPQFSGGTAPPGGGGFGMYPQPGAVPLMGMGGASGTSKAPAMNPAMAPPQPSVPSGVYGMPPGMGGTAPMAPTVPGTAPMVPSSPMVPSMSATVPSVAPAFGGGMMVPPSTGGGMPMAQTFPMSGMTGGMNAMTEQKCPPLPHGWTESIDRKSGKKYYKNHITKTTQWTRPVTRPAVVPSVSSGGMMGASSGGMMGASSGAMMGASSGGMKPSYQAPMQQVFPGQSRPMQQVVAPQPIQRQVVAPGVPQTGLPSGWEAAVDPTSGKVYYKNHLTKSTQWVKPVAPPTVVSTPIMSSSQPSSSAYPGAARRAQLQTAPAPLGGGIQYGQPRPGGGGMVQRPGGGVLQPQPGGMGMMQPQPAVIQQPVVQMPYMQQPAPGQYGSQPLPQQPTYNPQQQRPYWASP